MKNKILNYDFLIVGGGLVGSLAAIALYKKKYKVLVIEKNNFIPDDQRTLAVNANSRISFDNWACGESLLLIRSNKSNLIKDSINKEDLIFKMIRRAWGQLFTIKNFCRLQGII